MMSWPLAAGRWRSRGPRSDHMARGDLQGAVLEVAVPLAGPRVGQAADEYGLKAVLPRGNRDLAPTRAPAALLRDSGTT